MSITLITGVPGTGKTAFLVAELEKIAASGRIIFVDNIPGLKVPHYRAGPISNWQGGTWLHIDRYLRTSPSVVPPSKIDVDIDSDGNENWESVRDVLKDDDGKLSVISYDSKGVAVGSVPYENHKGALLVIDECQRHFRPRPAGSAVPDYVAALEVHRHQGLDIWLVTQRPALVDSNVRALCDKHVALRKTPFGRYLYEWPEVGDIDSKFSRDVASKSRFKLPKHVFSLYKSAEVHNVTSHKLPMVAKIFILCIPILAFLGWSSFQTIRNKFHPDSAISKKLHESETDKKSFNNHLISESEPKSEAARLVAAGFEPYIKKLDTLHPFQGAIFSIAGRVQSGMRDLIRFTITSPDRPAVYISDVDLIAAGYEISERSDCSVKVTYRDFSTFATCAGVNSFALSSISSSSPAHRDSADSGNDPVQIGSRSFENVVLADRTSIHRN